MNKIVLLVFVLMLLSTAVVVRFIRLVSADGTIYIRANGSVEGTTDILSIDNVTYTFTDNIFNQSIVVERDNIVVDGAGYTLQGTGGGTGIDLTGRSNVTIENMEIKTFQFGIQLSSSLYQHSKYNSFSGNNITNNEYGIRLLYQYSNYNSFSGNNITNNEYGIYLYECSNNTITGNNITKNDIGIYLGWSSKYNSVSGNDITNNEDGIWLVRSSDYNSVSGNDITNNDRDGIVLQYSSNNTVTGNNITENNWAGIYLTESSDNKFYHNNIIDNKVWQVQIYTSYANFWDDGVEGNYWNDYTGVDSNHDGVGDKSRVIDADNTDNFPLMGMFHSFNTSLGYDVNVISNSTIEDFQYFEANSTIKMHVSNMTLTQTFGFCRVCIPKGLMSPPYTVIINHGSTEVLYFNETIYDNGTHRWIYFAYQHSMHEVVIQGLDTTLPTIYLLSPENKTYPANDVPLTFTVDEPTDWIGYSLDGQMNVTISGNATLIGLSEGVHTITVYANDTAGNMGYSDTVHFTTDTVSPNIGILTPENKTYATSSVPLNFAVDEATSWMGHSLDGQMNVTITGNTTLSGLLDESHYVVVYANDTAGNMGASNTVYFTVDTTPPNITDVSQTPLENNVLPEDEVKINATVTDYVSGVKRVTLNYTNGNGTWITVDMTNLGGNVWNATIPAFPYCTNVTYLVIAEDNANNTITTEEMEYEYQYHVIPEFPAWTSMLLLFIVLTVAIVIYKRRLLKTLTH